MSNEALFAVSRAGMDYERQRVEMAARDIAMANTPIDPSQAGQAVGAASAFDRAIGAPGLAGERLVHDPANPMADGKGMVHYPKVDLVEEMGTLVSASRGYEANLRAFNALHSMMLSALSIGKDQ
jgi:flagellar basal-body rod protein FlgC